MLPEVSDSRCDLQMISASNQQNEKNKYIESKRHPNHPIYSIH